MRNIKELQMLQALPLAVKVQKTKQRIREWVDYYGLDGVYISFSGGKDSTALLHIAREMYPKMLAVFCDTGLEFPEIREFVKTYDGVVWLRPKMTFKNVITKYGYPFISKEVSGIIGGGQNAVELLKAEGVDVANRSELVRICKERLKKERGEWRRLAQCLGAITKDNEIKENMAKEERGMYSDIPQKYKFILYAPFKVSDKCCREMKKNIVHAYASETKRVPISAQMAEESRLRTSVWLSKGCNAFDSKHPMSNPMSFWTEQDVLQYLKEKQIPIASVYGKIIEDGELQGQMNWSDYCGFDIGRVPLKTTGYKRTGCMFCGYGCHLEKEGEGRFERMKETHPKQYDFIMRPKDKGGLNYKEVIDWLNENGNLHIRY